MKSKLVDSIIDRARSLLAHVDDQLMFIDLSGSAAQCRYISPLDFRAAASKIPAETGWLRPGIVRWGRSGQTSWFVLFIPPGVHSFFIQAQGNAVEQFAVPMPGLVYSTFQQHMIWAIKEQQSNPTAQIFHVPLPNISSRGLICFGENTRPDPGNPDRCWQLFLASPFNHHQADGKSRSHPKNIIPKLTALAQSETKTYPLDDLIACNQNVDQAFQAAGGHL